MKDAIRKVRLPEARELAFQAVDRGATSEVEALLRERPKAKGIGARATPLRD